MHYNYKNSQKKTVMTEQKNGLLCNIIGLGQDRRPMRFMRFIQKLDTDRIYVYVPQTLHAHMLTFHSYPFLHKCYVPVWVSSGCFGFLPHSKDMQTRLTVYSTSAPCTVCEYELLFLPVFNPVKDLQPTQGVAHLLPEVSWDWLKLLHDPDEYAVQIMDGLKNETLLFKNSFAHRTLHYYYFAKAHSNIYYD